MSYYTPRGGLPPQTELTTDRAVFTEAYAVLPRGTMRDIVTSQLPFWDRTRLWVIARPLSGFAETFSQYIVEVSPGGGSDRPEPDPAAEGVLFVVDGVVRLTLDGADHELAPGGYAFLPPGTPWALRNAGDAPATFHWIRKAYERVEGIDVPEPFVTSETDVSAQPMPDTDGAWSTQRFVDPLDVRHDMHVNIVSFEPGGVIPFPETHVMEHGLYVLEGKAVTSSTATGSRCRRATSCGCAPSVRRRATQAVPAGSATCSTRTSTGTRACDCAEHNPVPSP